MRRDMIDLTGQRFGRWTVLGLAWVKKYKTNRNSQARWRCRCDCGEVRFVFGHTLRRGASTQCKACGKEASARNRKTLGSVRLPDGRTIAQIADATGLRLDTVYHRHIRGWPAWRLGEVTQRRSA